ncbi:MAG TPA: hypothetical protein VLF43_03790 [Candidatus Saccharimonadales bacterium]|nr:hypothetical protein [Candidatus Saccharimonadales bacterium]
MNGEQLHYGEYNTSVIDETVVYLTTLVSMGTVQLPPVLQPYRSAPAFEAPAPAIATPAETFQPVRADAFKIPQAAYALGATSRESLALAA